MDYQRLYEYRLRNVDQESRRAVWQEIATFLHEAMDQPRCVLDPAAGRGEFINAVPAVERWAVDRHAYTEGTYDPGVNAVPSDIFDAQLAEASFDGIFVSNFLEHLPSQEHVASFLEKMRSLATDGACIALIGPNFRYCAAEYFDMADHTLALTHLAVAEHLYAAGFEPERLVARFLPYSFTGRLPASSRLARLYLKTKPARRVMGKQFLVIGRA